MFVILLDPEAFKSSRSLALEVILISERATQSHKSEAVNGHRITNPDQYRRLAFDGFMVDPSFLAIILR